MAVGEKQSINPRDALWASVGIAALLIIGAIVLIVFDKDITQLVMIANLVAIPILTGLGTTLYQKMTAVESNVNGRMTELQKHAMNSTPIPKADSKEE